MNFDDEMKGVAVPMPDGFMVPDDSWCAFAINSEKMALTPVIALGMNIESTLVAGLNALDFDFKTMDVMVVCPYDDRMELNGSPYLLYRLDQSRTYTIVATDAGKPKMQYLPMGGQEMLHKFVTAIRRAAEEEEDDED